jgi:hypothetical protein
LLLPIIRLMRSAGIDLIRWQQKRGILVGQDAFSFETLNSIATVFNCAEAGSRLFCAVHLVAFSRLGSVASIAAAPVVVTALTPLVALAVQGAPLGQEAGGAQPVGSEVAQEQVDLVPADCLSAVAADSQALTVDDRCAAALAEQHSARADW